MNFRTVVDARMELLKGDRRLWWDQEEGRMITAVTLYIPYGCLDWGERGGKRNPVCIFCSAPLAAANYRREFYGGAEIPARDHTELFCAALKDVASEEFHTLMIFNAGSFLAMPVEIQRTIVQKIILFPFIQRVVVESRAELITLQSVKQLLDALNPAGKKLTIRIGVETQDDYFRLKVLKKGHTRRQLFEAVEVMRQCGVTSGGYALLNPSPGLDESWAMEESEKTIDWILGGDFGQLGMEECYFCSANVGPDSLLSQSWEKGEFSPPNLWMVLKVMQYGSSKYGARLHLLPFKDEPPFLAVPSNHVLKGIPQGLNGAQGCDLAFHDVFNRYRQTMDPYCLVSPQCECKPEWF